MTYSTATVADVTAFRGRDFGRDFAAGEFRRAVFGTFFVGVGSVAALVAVIGCVTLAAGGMLTGLHAGHGFHIKRPFALGAHAVTKFESSALEKSYHDMARDMQKAMEISAAIHALMPQTRTQSVKLILFKAPPGQAIDVAELESAAINSSSAQNDAMPLPSRRPLAASQAQRQAQVQAQVQLASAGPVQTTVPAASETTGSVPAQSGSFFGNALRRLLGSHAQPSRTDATLLASVDNHTAVYDIEAHVVYLPNGERMEAHSGLGQWIDDPGHVNMKARGATPPNVYNLTMREGLFHGVEALRLNPVGDNSMYGRDGILAHPYMLGPSGQSFGCVSFKDYQAFLQAFKRGEVNRMVVVSHVDGGLPAIMHANRDGGSRYAFD